MVRQWRALLAVLGSGVLAAGSLACGASEDQSQAASDPPSAAAALRTAKS